MGSIAKVYVDEFSTILSEEIDEDFGEEYRDEYAQLILLKKLIRGAEELARSLEKNGIIEMKGDSIK
jgi:hypothetical protein